MQKNLTTGSVFQNILFFSLPYLLSYFLQTLYGMADLFIIGQFEGVADTTAVSIGSQVMHMLTVMLVGLAMGSTVSIGQAVGGRKDRQAAVCIGNTVTLFMGLSLVLTVVLLAASGQIVKVMSTPAQAVSGTLDYLTICFMGIPFITAYNIISSIFLMGALHMGPSGAALGTTLSQAVSVAVSLAVILKRGGGLSVRKQDFKPLPPVMGRLLKIGVPIALQDGFIQISFIVITIIANRRGLNDAAAVGIVEKIISFLFLVPSSMLSTVSALGAQNIGAGCPDRAQRTLGYAIAIAAGFGLLVSVLMQFLAEPMVSLFTDASQGSGAQVVRLGGQYLRGYVLDCMFAGIHFSFSGYFCACGKSGLSFLHNSIAILLVRIPGAFLASAYFPENLFPMGLATSAGSLLSVVICVIAFRLIAGRGK